MPIASVRRATEIAHSAAHNGDTIEPPGCDAPRPPSCPELRYGHFVWVDFCSSYNRYHADLARINLDRRTRSALAGALRKAGKPSMP